MWCRRQHARPEVLDFYVMRVLSGESAMTVSAEAGIPHRTLQVQVMRARERNAKMMGDARGRRGHSSYARSYGRQGRAPDEAQCREEADHVWQRQRQEQHQRHLLPSQDQYIYEVHHDPSNDAEPMEVDDTSSMATAQMQSQIKSCAALNENEATAASEWATEGEGYPRKRRKTRQ